MTGRREIERLRRSFERVQPTGRLSGCEYLEVLAALIRKCETEEQRAARLVVVERGACRIRGKRALSDEERTRLAVDLASGAFMSELISHQRSADRAH